MSRSIGGGAAAAIRPLTGLAFARLGRHELTAGGYGDHVGSVRSFEKAGFVVEGVRPRHFRLDGKWVDLVQLGAWSE